MNYVSLVIAIAIFVVVIVAYIQIITKAGYSAWWILVPLAMPLMYLITAVVLIHDAFDQSFGPSNVTTLTNEFGFLATIDLLVVIANFVMFLVFAFSEWPVMREARSRRPPTGGVTFGLPRPPGGPFGPAPAVATAATFPAPPPPVPPAPGGAAPTLAPATPAPPLAAPSGPVGNAPAGWYRSGALGAGEQSYWDGAAWKARRIWNRGAWKALVLEDQPTEGPATESTKG